MRQILITGGAGFIGSHLTRTLLERGDAVSILDNLSTGRLENVDDFIGHERFSFAFDDIRNEQVLDRLASQAHVIVHLAAAVGVELVVERPAETIETNVLGTHLVLEAARRYRCRTLVASTSEVYGKGVRIPFDEEDDLLLGPSSRSRWCYAASKLLDEFLALATYREYELPVTIIRFFNTVGPGQTGRYGMVIPRFVGQALRGEPLTVYGSGMQSRCFCHVADTVEAVLAIIDASDSTAGQIYNVGSTNEISINALAQAVIERSDSASTIKRIPYNEAYGPGFEDMERRVPKVDKIRGAVGWTANRTLEEILDDVIDYERKRLRRPEQRHGR
ncbi:MAG: NAD-dependent epimerase/dehydratase family protein [Acidobacteria bacterium]|nr:MAG: NAD-dependent epimerase/dehydratase family protein [Acidobacteriota bacterium]